MITFTVGSALYLLFGVVVPRLLLLAGIRVPLIHEPVGAPTPADSAAAALADAQALAGAVAPKVLNVVKTAEADVEAVVAKVLAKLHMTSAPAVAAAAPAVNVVHNADGSTSVVAPGVNVTTAPAAVVAK